MGCCSSDITDAVSAEIDNEGEKLHKEQKLVKKLLFLGTGSSGKSTLLKTLKEVNGQSIMDRFTVQQTATTMRLNVLTMMHTLCAKSVFLTELGHNECDVDVGSDMAQKSVELISHFGDNRKRIGNAMFQVGGIEDVSDDMLPALGKAVAFLWSIPEIKTTFRMSGGRFFMEENIDFFFDKCLEIFDAEYIVTREDVIKTRVRTTGAVTYEYNNGGDVFQVVDVGGQRCERRHWYHQFADVSAIAFVTALNHFNVRLFELEDVNAMIDALDLFEQISNDQKFFKKTEMIVFLNKEDLFRKMLSRGESLSLCFSQTGGNEWAGVCWSDEENPVPAAEDGADAFEEYYQKALDFVKCRFLERNRVSRTIYTHVMSATESDGMAEVFLDVQCIVLSANLIKCGMAVGGDLKPVTITTNTWTGA